ncbi:MAG: hypothetical protein ACXWD8_18970 [Mycobacterium sp.]
MTVGALDPSVVAVGDVASGVESPPHPESPVNAVAIARTPHRLNATALIAGPIVEVLVSRASRYAAQNVRDVPTMGVPICETEISVDAVLR